MKTSRIRKKYTQLDTPHRPSLEDILNLCDVVDKLEHVILEIKKQLPFRAQNKISTAMTMIEEP
jgi:hypothetical protein